MALPTQAVVTDALKHLDKTYSKNAEKFNNLKALSDNVIDPLSACLHIAFGDGIDSEAWLRMETSRRIDKALSNGIGVFHEQVLSSIEGWEKPKTGFDLRNEDKKIIIEIKNKHNTTNSSAEKEIFGKCEHFVKSSPDWKAYLAQIIPKGGGVVNRRWKVSGRTENPNIYQIDGKTLYDMVTDEKNALEKVYMMFPEALSEMGKEFTETDFAFVKRLMKQAYGS